LINIRFMMRCPYRYSFEPAHDGPTMHGRRQ